MEGWAGVSLTIGVATADLKQLYPTYAAVGVDPATATTGQQMRRPCEGTLLTLQVETDSVTSGTLELYDISGLEVGANVSSLAAITNAQLVAGLADGRAKLIFRQTFAGSGLSPWEMVGPRGFMKGLAARAIGGAGVCYLNMTVRAGFEYTTKGG